MKGLEFSQQAGLNIKLREQARHRWIAILDGGIGLSPILYNASAFAMRISGKWQNMETIRVNNTGWNPQLQSQKHTVSNLFSNDYTDKLWPDYINLGITSVPLAENRTRDNFSVLANSSNSWHLDKGKDVRFNINYESDRLDYQSGYETNYLDERTFWKALRIGLTGMVQLSLTPQQCISPTIFISTLIGKGSRQ